ncbi:MerR family DNA-binding transcriptional regulator [Halioxenophilus sp. WMMB6]|uniref:MerR family transcriptional regulator n=1 Tax=Halioxenophilus sp. WMMB6 TaxID=3073815 RepID=UPI00295F1D21|nr:MerR family DNA-binding transcriptional regulator [Halioxenophilus sp. WMMB6]
MAAEYTISDLSAEFDITTRTIRFYEEKGLLSPRREGSSRIYTPADRTKLRLILRGKRLGFTLEESRSIIDMYDPEAGNHEQMQSLLAKIREKRHQLEQQLHDIEVMMLDLRDSEERCLEAMASPDQSAKQS